MMTDYSLLLGMFGFPLQVLALLKLCQTLLCAQRGSSH